MVTLVFFTYVLFDMFHLIIEWPDLGGIDMAAHHVVGPRGGSGAHYKGVWCPLLGGQVPIYRDQLPMIGWQLPITGGQVPIIGGAGAHYREVRCPL
jgi:hypothetical protein